MATKLWIFLLFHGLIILVPSSIGPELLGAHEGKILIQ